MDFHGKWQHPTMPHPVNRTLPRLSTDLDIRLTAPMFKEDSVFLYARSCNKNTELGDVAAVKSLILYFLSFVCRLRNVAVFTRQLPVCSSLFLIANSIIVL